LFSRDGKRLFVWWKLFRQSGRKFFRRELGRLEFQWRRLGWLLWKRRRFQLRPGRRYTWCKSLPSRIERRRNVRRLF
jgi:hypothetical protein